MAKAKSMHEPIDEEKALFSTEDEALEKKDRAKFDPDDEMVTVTIHNLLDQGHPIPVDFGPVNNPFSEVYTHGFKYTIPRRIIKFIESRQRPIHDYIPDGKGKMVKKLIGYENRFHCRHVF